MSIVKLSLATPSGANVQKGILWALVAVVVTHLAAFGIEPELLLRRDLMNLVRPRNLAISAMGLGVAGVAHRWDDDLAGEVGDVRPLNKVLDLGNLYGSSTLSLTITSGMWGLAKVTGLSRGEAVFSDLLRAILLANVVVTPIKFVAQRERPDGSDNLSFPSGHTANAFAMTAVLTRRYGPRFALPLYAFTAAVPLARIDRDRHFFSDVVAGAILGTVAGYAVTLRTFDGATPLRIQPRYGGGFLMIKASLHY
jgi:membrane-associated phospholipid phosphatase